MTMQSGDRKKHKPNLRLSWQKWGKYDEGYGLQGMVPCFLDYNSVDGMQPVVGGPEWFAGYGGGSVRRGAIYAVDRGGSAQ